MTETASIYKGDSLTVTITVRRTDGTVLDLTGATLATKAELGTTTVTGTVSSPSPTAGVAVLYYAPGALTQGIWTVQARVTKGSEAQTVYDARVSVLDSVI